MIFSIPCKFDPAHPIIFDCIQNIKNVHPGAKIIIHDSNSEDRSYLSKIDVDYIHLHNENYETGSIWKTYFNYAEHDYYWFIHDSILIKKRLDNFMNYPLTSFAWFEGWWWSEPDEMEWAEYILPQTTINYKDHGFTSIFGSAFGCDINVLDKMSDTCFYNVQPQNKMHSRAMERMWGLALTQEGYEPHIRENSIYGRVYDIWQLHNDYFDKIIMRRQ